MNTVSNLYNSYFLYTERKEVLNIFWENLGNGPKVMM